jgi:dTDP-glucose pyrophosphorylase
MERAVKGVVLAAGRGSRMRAADPGVTLDPAQEGAAREGRKPLIPFHGHPFLSYSLTELARAGILEVCLVVPPGKDPLRSHYESLCPSRLQIRFAVQESPRGSAHALLAAEDFAAGDPVVVLNGDNLYPAAAIEAVSRLPGHGLIGFEASGLVALGGISPERIRAFAVLIPDRDGCLREIREKPGREELAAFGHDPLVSMTCWRFTSQVFDACRLVQPSPRGELELPDAAMYLVREAGACIRVHPLRAGVFDLTGRADIAAMDGRLKGREVSF